MNKIYFNPNRSHELKSNNFDNHAYQFQYILKQFIYVRVNNIECQAILNEWIKILD